MNENVSSEKQLTLSEERAPVVQGEFSVMALMERMIDKLSAEGADQAVAGMEKLLAIHIQLEDRRAEQEFHEAFAAFKVECPPIPKNKTAGKTTDQGGKFGYTWADLEQTAKVVDPILSKHGLSYSWDSLLTEKTMTVTCTLRHIGGHAVSSNVHGPVEIGMRVNPAQMIGAAESYYRRYALTGVLALTTCEDDTDGEPPPSLEKINEEEAATLIALMDEAKANRPKFLAHFNIATVADMPKSRLQEAVTLLQQKMRSR
jgi:hypothetical protein